MEILVNVCRNFSTDRVFFRHKERAQVHVLLWVVFCVDRLDFFDMKLTRGTLSAYLGMRPKSLQHYVYSCFMPMGSYLILFSGSAVIDSSRHSSNYRSQD